MMLNFADFDPLAIEFDLCVLAADISNTAVRLTNLIPGEVSCTYTTDPSELYRQRSPVRYILSEWAFTGSSILPFIQTGRSKNDAVVFSLLLMYPRATTRPSTTSSPTAPIGVSLLILFGSTSQLRPPTAVPIVVQSEFNIRPLSSDLTLKVAMIDVSLGPVQS